MNEQAAENINCYVENGGNLVMSFFSGVADENEHIRLGGYPAPFREMLGIVVEECVPYSETESNTFCTNAGKQFQCSFWSDVIQLKTAQAIATYEQDYYTGTPAITRSHFGKGTAIYVGTAPDPNGMAWLLEQVCETAGIQLVSRNAPAGVELVQRSNGNSAWLFILNHSMDKVTVPFQEHGHDLLTGAAVNGSIELEPTGVAIIQLKQQA